ncbi:MAG TPA: response regulator [Dehalococcoidia bacterium]|jgi:CheY-like chemotaxis protein|nr:response regulator [Dehalococcoidia bacterium]
MEVQPVEILLVEDNPGDVRLTIEALKSAKISNSINVVRDGIEAMAYLRKEGQYANVARPGIVLLDLNLPKKSGYEVLEELKKDEDLRRIPVVVLTSSQAEEDILRSYNLHANSYVTKPVGLQEFAKVVGAIEGFWLTIVQLPPK